MFEFSDLLVKFGGLAFSGLHLGQLRMHSGVVLLELHASSLSSISPSSGVILDVLELSGKGLLFVTLSLKLSS